MTDFQKKIYDALMLIPSGKVTTYKFLSNYVNCNSSQAVGQALKKNPHAPQVPCHRVIKSDLTIGGYSGETDGHLIRKKLQLLKNEGVLFDQRGRLADKDYLFDFSI